MIKVSAIVAMAENGCIGLDNKMPWHIPADLKHFKTITMGKPIIMGRKTFQSIFEYLGKPLPGRTSIVISRSGFEAEGAITCTDIDSAIAKAKDIAAAQNIDEIIIGGGAQIYELALPYTDRIHLTRIHAVVNGDTFFPDINPDSNIDEWKETNREDHDGTNKDGPAFSFMTLERA